MKVLLIGGGAREHALAWALARTPHTELLCAPGNPGISTLARCIPIPVTDLDNLVSLALSERPALTVIGPELPLALGLTNRLEAHGLRVFGPTQSAAQLETSKSFAKEFMRRHDIPTAAHAVCTTLAEVAEELPRFAPEVVVKADGLAAGKGVVLCRSHREALIAARDLFDGTLTGAPETTLVLEELLTGEELSFFALSDGTTALPLAAAQDHKRIGEGDTGPNTGGMGAYSTPHLLPPARRAAFTAIAQRVVDGMRSEGDPFTGVLFVGLMLTPRGPMVLEFNTRFGDPETEAILLRLETPLLDLLNAAVDGFPPGLHVRLHDTTAAAVILASAGYPSSAPNRDQPGQPISGLDQYPPSPDPQALHIFHAGTALSETPTYPGAPHAALQTVTAGGRVLALATAAPTLREALNRIYAATETVTFPGMQLRRDIGHRALEKR